MIRNGNTAINATWSFTRNPASQISSEARDNDIYAWDGHVNVTRNYTVNGLNQYTQVGTNALCHDPNGNLIADGTRVYRYDVENRLVEMYAQASAACPTDTTGYTGALLTRLSYDPMGRLRQVVNVPASATTRYLHDGDVSPLANFSRMIASRRGGRIHGHANIDCLLPPPRTARHCALLRPLSRNPKAGGETVLSYIRKSRQTGWAFL